MYILKTQKEFDAAHFLKGYDGKCSNIHGHRWKVVAEVGSETLQSEGNTRGMVVDFSELKNDLKAMVDCFDHKLIIETGSLKESTMAALMDEAFAIIELPMRPTAENFAKYFYDELKKLGYMVVSMTVYETPKNCATYREMF
ncbi:MAG: 6-carboxytetrahydropterin synthase QueD [Lachnospiraceae bacterium]|nr:6-carboxytetrahydropterin synthase QueD [Lachnospiraceae bacterium]